MFGVKLVNDQTWIKQKMSQNLPSFMYDIAGWHGVKFKYSLANDDMVQVTHNFKDHFINNSSNTNIYIARFTASHARLMLCDKLDYLQEVVLYFVAD